MTCALYKCMKHVSLLFCSWDAQVKIKSPMIIVRTIALPSNWAETDWIAGNTENNIEYINWHTYVFSVFSHDAFPFNFSNCTWTANKLYIIFHSLTFLFILNNINFLYKIIQVNDCLHISEEKTIALLLYFVDKYKLYSSLKSTLKILFSLCGSLKSRSLKIFCFS